MTKKAAARKVTARKTRTGSLKARAFGEAASEFGREIAPLGTRAGALAAHVGNLLLGMFEGTVFGVEKVSSWLHEQVTKRLKDTAPKQISAPDSRIAVPAVQALVYSMGEEHIREMFANLLAASMVRGTKSLTHPAFVEIIKEMTSLEATTLSIIAERPQWQFRVTYTNGKAWIDAGFELSFVVPGSTVSELRRALSNLQRLALIELREGEWPVRMVASEDGVEAEISSRYSVELQRIYDSPGEAEKLGLGEHARIDLTRHGIFLTPLGESFVAVCLPRTEDATAHWHRQNPLRSHY